MDFALETCGELLAGGGLLLEEKRSLLSSEGLSGSGELAKRSFDGGCFFTTGSCFFCCLGEGLVGGAVDLLTPPPKRGSSLKRSSLSGERVVGGGATEVAAAFVGLG